MRRPRYAPSRHEIVELVRARPMLPIPALAEASGYSERTVVRALGRAGLDVHTRRAPVVQAAIAAVRSGMRAADAADAYGISERTIQRHMRRGMTTQ